jgi:hypothetical protein
LPSRICRAAHVFAKRIEDVDRAHRLFPRDYLMRHPSGNPPDLAGRDVMGAAADNELELSEDHVPDLLVRMAVLGDHRVRFHFDHGKGRFFRFSRKHPNAGKRIQTIAPLEVDDVIEHGWQASLLSSPVGIAKLLEFVILDILCRNEL